MKKLLLVLFLGILVTFSINAQQYATKGTLEFGGTISYSSMTTVTNGTAANNSTSILSFMPAIGYFISDQIGIGISPGINSLKMAGDDNAITNMMLFAVVNYTFSNKGNVFPFVEGMVGYTSLGRDANTSTGTPKIDNSGISFGGRGGIRLLVGKSGLANISVSYMMITMNPEGADKRNGYDALAFTLGFSVFLGK